MIDAPSSNVGPDTQRVESTRVVLVGAEQERAHVRAQLDAAGGFEVVGEAVDAHAGCSVVRSLPPDLVVLIDGPTRSRGLDLLALLARSSSGDIRVLLVSTSTEPASIARAFGNGAWGVVHAESDGDLLAAAVRAVASGDRFVDPVFRGSSAEPSG